MRLQLKMQIFFHIVVLPSGGQKNTVIWWFTKTLSPAAGLYLNTGSSNMIRLLSAHRCPSGHLCLSPRRTPQNSSTKLSLHDCKCRPGTGGNCIKSQLIWSLERADELGDSCWQMDWWTGLLLRLIFLLLLLVLLHLLPPFLCIAVSTCCSVKQVDALVPVAPENRRTQGGNKGDTLSAAVLLRNTFHIL